MKINSIKVQNQGYIQCKSDFYSVLDVMSNSSNYTFFSGTNKLIGGIDSGVWAVSYLLSMYKYRPEDFNLFESPNVIVNNEWSSLNEVSEYTCYMDRLYPLFSTDTPVKKLVEQGLDAFHLEYTPDEIRQLFYIDGERFERPLRGMGNEKFKAMAAIGFCHGKQIFCFPWLSKKRFDGYHLHLSCLPEILEDLQATVILPVES